MSDRQQGTWEITTVPSLPLDPLSSSVTEVGSTSLAQSSPLCAPKQVSQSQSPAPLSFILALLIGVPEGEPSKSCKIRFPAV